MIATAALLLVTLTVTTSTTPADLPLDEARAFHVRSLDARAQEWIRIGTTKSRTFAELLDRLAKSDVIVYVQVVDRIPGGIPGHLFFVADKRTVRYLRVEVTEVGSTADMVALLGHELQHAVEIANAPRVKNSQTMATMYLQLGGTHVAGARYDSLAARNAGERIRAELSWHRG